MSMKTGSFSNVVAQRNTSVKKNIKKNFVSNKKNVSIRIESWSEHDRSHDKRAGWLK